MTWWGWMILGAVLLSAELFAVDAQFYLVFLGVSAALVGLAGLLGVVMPEWVEWLTFAIIALIFFVTFRRALYDKIRGGGQGYQTAIAGGRVTVEADLAPGDEARTEYRGSEWTVRNVGESPVNGGTHAKVVKVDGVTLHVVAE